MISVCLVDDQNLVRQGVRSLLDLAEDIRVVAECADGAQAVLEIPRIKPDVVLLDLRMPNMSGLEVLQALSARNELPPTIILTTFDDDQLVLQGLKAGARGYLLKDVSLEQLVEAVRTVAAGEALLFPAAIRRLASTSRVAGQRRMAEAGLTEREQDVLRLVAAGHSNAEIAGELFVGVETVKTHVASLLAKLGVRDRTQAVIAAYESGFVGPSSG